ncbi:MAG: hypothetical protein AB1411_11480 [Nitrospirota bacterium]
MTIRRADWLFVLAVVAVVLFVSLLPSPRENNPPVPDTPEHRGVGEKLCSQCHAPGQSRPLPSWHPKRQDCFRCHKQG